MAFKKEPENEHDSNAICILTQNNELLGYVPRYYNHAILERLEKGMSYSCRVIDVNRNLYMDCSECIKVKLKMPKE